MKCLKAVLIQRLLAETGGSSVAGHDNGEYPNDFLLDQHLLLRPSCTIIVMLTCISLVNTFALIYGGPEGY